MARKAKFTTFLWCLSSFAIGGVIATLVAIPLTINYRSNTSATITQSTQITKAQIDDWGGAIEFASNSVIDQLVLESFKLVDESTNTFNIVLTSSKLTLDVINSNEVIEIQKGDLKISAIFMFSINGNSYTLNVTIPLNNEVMSLNNVNKLEFNDLKISFDIKFVGEVPTPKNFIISYN